MSSEPRPEGEPYLIWDRENRGWWRAENAPGVTLDISGAARWSRDVVLQLDRAFSYVFAVPLSVALRDGPPVETPEEPRPGEVWCRYDDGAFAQVLEVRGGRVLLERPSWTDVFEEPLGTWHDEYRPVNHGEADNHAGPLEPAPGSQSIGERLRRARLWHAEVWQEIERIIRGNRPFASAHEGLAIFEEEAEELQREIRHGTLAGIVEEATQAAAVAVRILTDCGGEPLASSGNNE